MVVFDVKRLVESGRAASKESPRSYNEAGISANCRTLAVFGFIPDAASTGTASHYRDSLPYYM